MPPRTADAILNFSIQSAPSFARLPRFSALFFPPFSSSSARPVRAIIFFQLFSLVIEIKLESFKRLASIDRWRLKN